MTSWTFYPAFVATLLSVTLLTRLAIQEHDSQKPRTLSELAASDTRLLRQFRMILFVCGTLFSISIFFYIAPAVENSWLIAVVWLIAYLGEILLAIFPATSQNPKLHNIPAYTMGLAMNIMPFVLATNLDGVYAVSELLIGVVMFPLIPLANLQRHKFLQYELPFIYLSHLSILVALVALA